MCLVWVEGQRSGVEEGDGNAEEDDKGRGVMAACVCVVSST